MVPLRSDGALRIVHVVRQYVPFVGGLEFVVHDLAREQVKLGHNVRVVTLERRLGRDPGTLPKSDYIDGVEVRRIPHLGSRRYPIAPSVVKHILDADIVHVHAIDFFFDFLAVANIFLRKTLFVSTHGGFFHTAAYKSLKKVWFYSVTKLSLQAYAAVICVSHQDETTFRKIRPRGIRALLNGVDVEKFRGVAKASDRRSLVTVGRFAPNKRYDLLLDTIVELRKHGDWTLSLLGVPDQLTVADVKQMIAERALGNAVELVVSPTNEQIRARLASADIFVSASAYEGFGISAVEALSAGLPVILSDIPPYRSLTAALGQGLLVNFEQPCLVAKSIEDWRVSYRDTEANRTDRIAFASTFGSDMVASATVDIYKAALGHTTRHISGLDVDVMSPAAVIASIENRMGASLVTKVVFANSNLITRLDDDEKRSLSEDRDTIVLNDGVALDAASFAIYGRPFPLNLNGTDFLGRLFSGLEGNLKIFLLGGKPGVSEKAAEAIRKIYPRHEVVGHRHGFYERRDLPAIVEKIRATGADTILCAMGNPLQERWLIENLDGTGCKLGLAVGAYLDFVSGEAQRAPIWMRKARMEWLYRLGREPRRLISRYTLGIARFFGGVLSQVLRGYRIS